MMTIQSTLADDSRLDNFSQVERVGERVSKQMTILNIREVDDNEQDYQAMEIKDFVKLPKDELRLAYNRL